MSDAGTGPSAASDFDALVRQKKEREEAARPAFEQWRSHLHLRGWGYGVPAFDRYRAALSAVRDWR